MAASYSQETRLGKLHAPEGLDSLALLRLDGEEAVNGLFDYRVEAISDRHDLDFDRGIGRNFTVELNSIAHGPRFFDGLLTEVRRLDAREGGHVYALTLRPWFWLAGRRRNQRIFHEKTVQEILNDVLGDYSRMGAPAYESKITGSYPRLEYTVQYRESDLDFASRMMEMHGISYYFRHARGNHTLVLADGADGFAELPGGTRPYYARTGQHVAEEEHFETWEPGRRFTTGKIVLTDYNFKTPTAQMRSEQTGNAGYAHGRIESFDYPGKYVDKGEGDSVARLRMDQERGADWRHSASGDIVSLAAGMKLRVTDHPDAAIGAEEYLCVAAELAYVSEGYSTGDGGGQGEESFRGAYAFAQTGRPIAPANVTPRPFVRGPQTATVVGEGEIDCDEHGRIMVRFHWDLEAAHSMRCRVAQMWAGKGWGTMFIPRVGMEVVVEFIEGDPDRPLVTGCVYNGENTTPYGLPGQKNLAGMKSNSTTGGGGYNEIVFDDSQGAELFRQHAQYNMDTTVLNNEKRHVIVDRTTEIGQNEKKTVGENQTVDIGTDLTVTVGQNETREITQSLEITANTSIKLICGSSTIEMTPTAITLTSMSVEIEAGANLTTRSGLTASHEASATLDIRAGLVKINS